MVEVLLTMGVAVLIALGIVGAMIWGHFATSATNLEQQIIAECKILAFGCGVAALCWLLVWWLDGVTAVMWPYCLIGFVPMTILCSYEHIVGDKNWNFGHWLIYGAAASFPLIGVLMVVLFGLINFIHSFESDSVRIKWMEINKVNVSD